MAEDHQDLADLVSTSDQLLINYLESTENYLRSALEEEQLLKEGFINIAHARMCMKPNLISLQGFPNETTEEFSAATVTIDGSNEDASGDPRRELQTDSSRDLELRRLFGRSTPAGLKNAQLAFQRVLVRTVERANIFRELQENTKERIDLKEKLKLAVEFHENNISAMDNLSVSR